MKYSQEQQNIINHALLSDNIIVNAVAGSGKTTTILGIADKLQEKQPNKFINVITYNRDLADEVRGKVKEQELKNIAIHTYHSLLSMYFEKQPYSYDHAIEYVVKNEIENVNPFNMDILIIDEVQDMTELYCNFIKHILKLSRVNQLLLFGDEHQCLYKFKLSDHRFLTHGDKVFNKEMIRLPLTESYRITIPIMQFINNVCLGYNYLKANKAGPNVRYDVINLFDPSNIYKIANEIHALIETGQFRPDDIFILMNSVNSSKKSMLHRIENILTKKGIPIFVKSDLSAECDSTDLIGKCVISTFCGAKGRERKFVIVLGYDDMYFRLIDRYIDKTNLPDVFYVALTRASHKLWIISNAIDLEMPYHKISETKFDHKYIDKQIKHNRKRCNRNNNTKAYSATELITYIDSKLSFKLHEIVEKLVIPINKLEEELSIPDRIMGRNESTELVSNITGTMIPDYYTYKKTGISVLFTNVYNYYNEKQKTGIRFEDQDAYEKACKMFRSSAFSLEATRQPLVYIMYHNIKYKKATPADDFYIQENFGNVSWAHIVKAIPIEYDDVLMRFIGDNRLCEMKDDISYWLKLTNAALSIDKYHHKVQQIPDNAYTWLEQKELQKAYSRLHTEFSKYRTFYSEIPYMHKYDKDLPDLKTDIPYYDTNIPENLEICGRIDVIVDDILFEIKCTHEITLEHKLQLIIYMYMMNHKINLAPNKPEITINHYRLFNIKTNEIIEIANDQNIIDDIVYALVSYKFRLPSNMSDEVFLSKYALETEYSENNTVDLDEYALDTNNDDVLEDANDILEDANDYVLENI
jgi:nucleoside-triphosphatase THEP1